MSARSVFTKFAVVAALSGGVVAAGVAPLSASQPVLGVATLAGHPHVIVDLAGRPLYVLTSEEGAKIKCVKACLHVWPPLMLPANVGVFSHAAAVKGSLGWVKRGKFRQATYNGFPLYTFSGDTKPHEANGVGLKLGAGTWLLVNAWAKTAAATPVKAGKTTTTSSSSGGGW